MGVGVRVGVCGVEQREKGDQVSECVSGAKKQV